MANITYQNKDKNSSDPAIKRWRDMDANEVKAAVNSKVDKIIGWALSQNNFSDAYKAMLDGLANALGLKQDLFEPFTPLVFGSTTTWATAGKRMNNKTLVLTGNTTLAFTGLENGAEGSLVLAQDGVGGRTFAPPAGSKPSSLSINTVVNGVTFLGWKFDGTNVYWTLKKY